MSHEMATTFTVTPPTLSLVSASRRPGPAGAAGRRRATRRPTATAADVRRRTRSAGPVCPGPGDHRRRMDLATRDRQTPHTCGHVGTRTAMDGRDNPIESCPSAGTDPAPGGVTSSGGRKAGERSLNPASPITIGASWDVDGQAFLTPEPRFVGLRSIRGMNG